MLDGAIVAVWIRLGFDHTLFFFFEIGRESSQAGSALHVPTIIAT